MLKNYLIIAWRNLWKHKAFSIISILGLAIGMAAFLMIFKYVNYQWSYDDFHANGDQLYRVIGDYYEFDQLDSRNALSVGGVGTIIQSQVPEVEVITRMHPFYGDKLISNDSMVGTNSMIAKAGSVYFVDSTFFKVFQLPLVQGGISMIQNPDAIYISEPASSLLFKSSNPIGKWINIRNQGTNLSYFVAGVFKDLPSNSHLHFDYLLPLVNAGDWFVDDFGWSEFYTYVKLSQGQNPEEVADKVTEIVTSRRDIDPRYKDTFTRFFLQPINKIHTNHELSGEPSGTIDPKIIGLLAFSAFFILIIAYINYINMSISRSLSRSLEVGVRKAIGANKRQLIGQFLLETTLINLCAIGGAILLIGLSAPYLNHLLEVPSDSIISYEIPVMAVLVLLLGALLSGFYPALVISSYGPFSVGKSSMIPTLKNLVLRRSLIVVQFATTLLLVIGAYTISRQIHFMKNHDLGFDHEQVMIINRPLITDSTYTTKLNSFNNSLLRETFIQDFTVSTNIPGRQIGWYTDGVQRASDPDNLLSSRMQSVDFGYVDLFGLSLVAGRNFNPQLDENQNVILINETAVYHYGFKNAQDAVGAQMIRERRDTYTIVGVVADYHQESLKRNYQPTVFFLNARSPYYLALKLQSVDENKISRIEESWGRFFGDNPFTYFFLDDYFNQQYQDDVKFGRTISLFAVLASVVALMGLLALTSATVNQRVKEIGIRKVMGASISNILVLLTYDMVRLIAISYAIAIPLIYYGILQWLEGFAFRMDLNAWIFIIPGVLMVLIALVTLSASSVKASLANPVDALRSE